MRLTVADLAAERGGEPVFDGIGFQVRAGEALVVTGPNGAGKSTLLRVLAGLLQASKGRIALDGTDLPSVAAASHWLGHRDAMKPALTVAENLRFWRDFLGEPLLDIDEALARVGLPNIGNLPYAYLSAGQRRRAAAARLLVSHRPIWLLDEPTAALDAASEQRFAGLMREHLAGGGIIVAATHQPLGLDGALTLRMEPVR
jgi:heme exporter protein A